MDEKHERRNRLALTYWAMNYTDERAGAKQRYLKIVDDDPRDFSGLGWQPYREAIAQAVTRQDKPIPTEVISAKEYLPLTAQPPHDEPVKFDCAAPKVTAQALPEPQEAPPQLNLF